MTVPTLALASGVAVLLLLVLSAFFSSSETALFSLSDEQLARMAEAGGSGRLLAVREDPHRLLVTILVGNNVVNVAISSIATLLLVEYLPPGQAALATTAVVSVLVLVFGEIVPKAYGLGHAETWSVRVAGPLRAVELALYPVVVAFDAVTRHLSRLIGGDADVEGAYGGE
jgi:Mg2+/Co2+ transporter CorB